MNQLWLRSSALLLCLVQLVAASQSSRANDIAAGDKLVPKETLVFLTVSDVAEFKKKWDRTSTGQLLQEPQLKPFLDDVYKRIGKETKDWEEDLGISINNFLELPQGQMTIALLEVPATKLSFVTIVEYGDHQVNVDKLVKEMDEALEKQQFEHSTEDINKTSVHVYTRKGDGSDNPFKTVVYFTDKSSLVISNEIDAIKEVLERWDGNSNDTLADNDQYKYIQSQCKTESNEPLIKIFANPIGLIKSGLAMAQTTIPQAGMVGAFIPMLGFDGLKGWGGASDFDDGDFEWVANFFMYSEEARGLLGLFNFPASQLAPPKWVPATAASYFVTNWNVQGAYKSIETLMDSFQGRGATARLMDSLADQDPGIHWKKDFIDFLDGKIHFIQSEPKPTDGDDDGAMPGFLVALGLKDAAKMKKSISVIVKQNSNHLESREFNGETIYEIRQPDADRATSVAITEGVFVITNDTPLLEGMIRGQSGRGLSLADSPDYKKVAKHFPSSTSMLSFQRSDAQMKMYYDVAKKAGADAVDGIDFSKLPPFDVIAKYLVPNGSYIVPDKKGAKTVSFSLKRAD